jgi:hypothetical protein
VPYSTNKLPRWTSLPPAPTKRLLYSDTTADPKAELLPAQTTSAQMPVEPTYFTVPDPGKFALALRCSVVNC